MQVHYVLLDFADLCRAVRGELVAGETLLMIAGLLSDGGEHRFC